MMKPFTLYLLLFIVSYQANAQQVRWLARQGSGAAPDQTNGIAVDAQGNIVAVGTFDGTVSFGATTLSTNGGQDIFVAKYDSNGVCIWAKKAGGQFGDEGRDIAVDNSGGIYITGTYGQAGATFDGITVGTTGGLRNGYVAKYTSAGTVEWVKRIGGMSSSAEPRKIAVNASGKIYIAGEFYGNINFDGSQPITSTQPGGYNDVFVAQYDQAGTIQWANGLGGRKEERLTGLAVNAGGAPVITGCYDSLITFYGNTTYAEYLFTSNRAHWDMFVATYSASGGQGWLRSFGGGDEDESGGICVDAQNNIYATGYFRSDFKSGSVTANNSGTTNTLFLHKINEAGQPLWVKFSPYPNSLGYQKGTSLTISGTTILLAGYFGNKYKAGNTNMQSMGENNPLLIKYDTSGNQLWGMFGNTPLGKVAQGLSAAIYGNKYYYAGYISGSMMFGDSPITAQGAYIDGFICAVKEQPGVITADDPATLTVGNATTSSITLNWNGPSSEFRVLKKTTSTSTSPTDGDVVYEGSDHTITLSGLTPNTAYFFTVYGKASGSATYSTGNKKIAATTVSDNPDESVVTGVLAGETGVHTFGGTGVRISITGASVSDGNIRVDVNTNLTSTGTIPVDIDSIFDAIYWTVTNTGLGGGSLRYCITLDVSDVWNLVDFANYHILKRPDAGAAWEDLMSNASYTVTRNSPEITICGLSTFSEFVVAYSSAPTGINESSLNANISVYPNPASDIVYIRSQQHEPVISLYDMQGRMLRSVPMLKGNDTALQLDGIPAGIYMIQAGNSRKKIIVMD